MRRCYHCKRSLESELLPAGPNLGESYVVLGANPSVSIAELADSTAARSFIATPISPMTPISPILMDYFSADGPGEETEAETDSETHKMLRDLELAESRHQKPSASSSAALGLGESMAGVATHADLSRYVDTITKQRAHCTGLPVTAPVCKECIDSMTEEIDRKAERARLDKRTFTTHLHSVSSSSSSARREDTEVTRLEQSLDKVQQQMSFLEDNLQLMQKERQQLAKSHVEVLNDHFELLSQQESDFWQQINDFASAKAEFDWQRDLCTCQIEQLDHALNALQCQNVLNDAFYIWHSGDFGTINSFRMGQLDNVQVEWNEINAGFGESALLLCTVSSILGVTFTKFKIVPLGSFSKVIRLNSLPHMEYKLHGTEQDNYLESHFNLGLVAWLECLAQLMRFVAAKDHKMHFPYKIRATSSSSSAMSTVGGLNVCFLKNKREWTKALKYALTNMKWLIAWTSTRVLAQKILQTHLPVQHGTALALQ